MNMMTTSDKAVVYTYFAVSVLLIVSIVAASVYLLFQSIRHYYEIKVMKRSTRMQKSDAVFIDIENCP